MFYGWRIVSVAFLAHFIGVGLVFYSYGAFFKALAADFGGSRFGVAVGLAIMNVAIGLISPYLGHRLDRGSIRNVMCLGALLMSAGFVAASRINALWQFNLVMGSFLAVGIATMGGLAATTLVANWFSERRGMALGIAGMGISLSGFAMAPIATLLIGSIGWRDTFLVYAVVPLLIVIPAARLFVVDRPEDIGMSPDGAESPESPPPPEPASGLPLEPPWSPRRALRDRNFWAIAVVVALNSCANGAMLTHIIPHATDIGIEPLAASFVLSCIAGFGVLGKVVFGWAVDRVDRRLAVWCATALQGIGVALILNVESFQPLLLAGAVYGLGMGGIVPLFGALVGAAFGRARFGRVTGFMTPVMLPIRILGIPYAGWIFDRTGSYDVAFLTFIGFSVLSLLATATLRLPEAEPGQRPTVAQEGAGS